MTLDQILATMTRGACSEHRVATNGCVSCGPLYEAREAVKALAHRATFAENIRVQLERQLAASPDERVRIAEGLAEMHLSTAREAHDQRQHATRHMMEARRARDAALSSLAHMNDVACNAQDESAKLHAEKDAVMRAGYGWVYGLKVVR